MQSFSEPRLVCRPALPSDTADVLEFTSRIWEGHDYIPYVWQDWLDDPHGLLAVAQFGLHAVGMAKATLLAPGQWWMEGLRVDPAHQGLKIGSHLHAYVDAWWLSNGDGIMRLMTSSERVQVHHLCEKTGYSKIGEVFGWRFPPASEGGADPSHPDGTPDFQPALAADVDEAVSLAAAHLDHSDGLMDLGWQFARPDATLLRRYSEQGGLHWWRGRQGLLGFHEDDEEGERVCSIALAAVDDARPGALAELLHDAGRLAQGRGFAYAHWLAPVKESIDAALKKAGFAPDWDHSGYLYQKPHPAVSGNRIPPLP